MKYVIINGSPRKKNTWSAVKQVKSNLEGEFEEIHLISRKIPMCNGCFKCIMEGEEKCPHYDIINPIVEKILNADSLIITSPVYAMNVTALLKNFFDHTAYLYHRPVFFTRKALVVVTTAGAGHNDVAKYMDETLRHWGFNKVHKLALKCGGKDLDTKKVNKTALEFKKDVESGKLHSPKLGDIVFYQVWRAMALKDNPIPADKKFWIKTGYVNEDFSPVVKLGIFKKVFAKIMFAVLKKVF